ncbi:MAG: hypothetical protein JO000_17185 [Alphaproteobacteria bacterium]|nr:hypothetical protein [Alphaproteobacteria bacterium]
MTKPIPDRAEVPLEYPEKLSIGTFDRSSRFDAHLDEKGLSLVLERTGDLDARKSVHLHLNFELLAEILRDIARTVAKMPREESTHYTSLKQAAHDLQTAFAHRKA